VEPRESEHPKKGSQDMSWYYVEQDQQKGPAEDAELEELVQQGVITGATLVWREGMSDWQPYSTVAGGAPAVMTAPPPPETTGPVCAECGQVFSPNEVIRLGGGFVCARCKPVALQKMREGVVSQSEEIRQEHIKHEASVKSIGLLYFLGAAFMFIFGLVGLFTSTRGRSGPSTVIAVLFIGLAAGQLWVGIGVRALKGWARVAAGILSGIGLLGFPLGTLINGYILYLLFSKKGSMVFSEDYKRVIQETPHIKYRTSAVVWVLLAILLGFLALGMFAMLFAG